MICFFQSAHQRMSSEDHQPSHSGKRNWNARQISAQQVGPTYHRRGSLQLWQFLLALLNDPANQAAIVWTGRGMEFKLIEPEEVSENVTKIQFMLTRFFLHSNELEALFPTQDEIIFSRSLADGVCKRIGPP